MKNLSPSDYCTCAIVLFNSPVFIAVKWNIRLFWLYCIQLTSQLIRSTVNSSSIKVEKVAIFFGKFSSAAKRVTFNSGIRFFVAFFTFRLSHCSLQFEHLYFCMFSFFFNNVSIVRFFNTIYSNLRKSYCYLNPVIFHKQNYFSVYFIMKLCKLILMLTTNASLYII